jgi:HSP20 family protein
MPRFPHRPWWSPFEEMEKMFEREFPRLWPEEVGFTPVCDVYQTDKDVVVETSVPGVEPEKVDVSVEDDTLAIKGETKKKVEVKRKDYFRKEIRTGSFSRVVTLPVPIVSEKAKAEFENGILKVTIPKAAPKKGVKKVAVKVSKKKK